MRSRRVCRLRETCSTYRSAAWIHCAFSAVPLCVLEFRVDGGGTGTGVSGPQALGLQLGGLQVQADPVDQLDRLAGFGQRGAPAQIAPGDQAQTECAEHGDHAQQAAGVAGAGRR
jgi:hypothetical protein